MEEPDWDELLIGITDRFPAYTFQQIGELTYPQLMALYRYRKKHPFGIVANVDPPS